MVLNLNLQKNNKMKSAKKNYTRIINEMKLLILNIIYYQLEGILRNFYNIYLLHQFFSLQILQNIIFAPFRIFNAIYIIAINNFYYNQHLEETHIFL